MCSTDLCDGLLDGPAAMQKFCKIAITEPDVSKVSDDSKHDAAKVRRTHVSIQLMSCHS
jgi:hypothetical protein